MQTCTIKKKTNELTRWVFLLLTLILTEGKLQAQAITSAQKIRIEQLYSKVQTRTKTISRGTVPCLVSALSKASLHQSFTIDSWLKQVPLLLQQGDSLCAFQLLNALQPLANHQPSAYLHWLSALVQAQLQVGQWQAALSTSEQLEKLATNNEQIRGQAICAKANALGRLIRFEDALRAGNDALTIARAVGDQALEVDALSIIGHTSRDIYRQVPAKYLPQFERASVIALALNDTTRILNTYRDLLYAHMFDASADLNAILDATEKSLNYLPQRPGRLTLYRLIWGFADGLSYFPQTQLISQQLYQQAMFMARQLHRPRDQRMLYTYLASIATEKKQYQQAAAYLDSAARFNSPDWEKDNFYKNQAEVQEAMGNVSLANKFYQKALAEKELVYLRRNSQSMTEWETRFRTQEKELQLVQEQTRQRWLLGVASLLLLLFGGAIFAYIQNRRQLRLLTHQKSIIEQQSRDLQRLDEAKTRFFSNITHEFRTPLTLILSPLETLVEQLPQHTTLRTIQTNANRLLGFINQLLDLSKIDAGMLRPELSSANIAAFLLQQEESFRVLAEARQVQLIFSKLPLDTVAVFDTDKLGKILANLISNALKFTPAGGQVSVTTIIDADYQELTIQITDTGSGIPADQLPHIFDRFYQVDDANTRRYSGSGIGLSLVKELVDVLGGSIEASSEFGRGTAFSLRLPISKPVTTQSFSTSEPTTLVTVAKSIQPSHFLEVPQSINPQSKSTIETKPVLLIVEDNDELRSYIEGLLSEQCYVITTTNGREGLQTSFEQIPDLVITDWMMPELDGIELCQRLKTDQRTSHIPVLMLTAKAAIGSRLNSLESGADDHIAKPFHPRELQLKVQNWIERQHRFRQHYQKQLTSLTETPPLPETDSAFMERVQHLIDLHLTDTVFGVEQLADKMAMSRRTLHRKIASLTGLTPVEVIRNHRLHRSLPHLRQGKPIADVAFVVGFETPSYFAKCFQELFGQKPSDMQQMGQ